MNELTLKKTMTVKEVAKILNVTPKTVRKYVKIFFPDLMEHGKYTNLNEYQTTVIKLDMQKNQHLYNHENEVDKIMGYANINQSVSVNKNIKELV